MSPNDEVVEVLSECIKNINNLGNVDSFLQRDMTIIEIKSALNELDNYLLQRNYRDNEVNYLYKISSICQYSLIIFEKLNSVSKALFQEEYLSEEKVTYSINMLLYIEQLISKIITFNDCSMVVNPFLLYASGKTTEYLEYLKKIIKTKKIK